MPECYANQLGGCEGRIENEHYISKSLQRMFGEVTVRGFPWQKGVVSKMRPGSYGAAHIICRKHHDDLDGTDEVAVKYFRNFMLLAGKHHLSSGMVGRAEDLETHIDGRSLERWFMKNLCGAVAAKTISGLRELPSKWVEALFNQTPWPEQFALYISIGRKVVAAQDQAFNLSYIGEPAGQLSGVIVRAYSVETVFAIEPLDNEQGLLRRPKQLRAHIQRPDGGDILDGLQAGRAVDIQFSWD